jgi:hypothetical protein
MLKGHMSFLYVGCRKFSINQFVRNFCPYIYTFHEPANRHNFPFKLLTNNPQV